MTATAEQAPAPPPQRKRSPWILVGILVAVFALPVIAAWLLYLNINSLHLGTSQHGEFVKPARALQMAPLPLPMANGTLSPDYFKGRFTLVYLSNAFCNPDCEEALILTRQTRIALGQKIESAQRLYLVEGTPTNPAKLLREQPDLTVADVSGTAGLNFIRQFSLHGKSAPDVGKYIYLVDPRGFYIMRYSISGPPEGLLRDLQHLLGQGGGM
jgi:cytochrome oxidase Cu insertion factor (SCO1/SenC/PrrC family)